MYIAADPALLTSLTGSSPPSSVASGLLYQLLGFSKVTDASELHKPNARGPMLVTEEEIVTDVSELQP